MLSENYIKLMAGSFKKTRLIPTCFSLHNAINSPSKTTKQARSHQRRSENLNQPNPIPFKEEKT
jgi:hypothetical protein